MKNLRAGVGPGMPNWNEDVRWVRERLSQWENATRQRTIAARHSAAAEIERAIADFQLEVMKVSPTGKLSPGDHTVEALKKVPNPPGSPAPPAPGFGPGPHLELPKRTGFAPLTDADYEAAAEKIGCEVLVIHALAEQETKGAPFESHGRPFMLFERAHFNQFTHHRFQRTHPNVTVPRPAAYGLYSLQWKRLDEAYLLDPEAALRAASWGQFQILGDNFRMLGFSTAHLLIGMMCRSCQDQLDMFVLFCLRKHGLQKALQDKDWHVIAILYNGRKEAEHDYEVASGDIMTSWKHEKGQAVSLIFFLTLHACNICHGQSSGTAVSLSKLSSKEAAKLLARLDLRLLPPSSELSPEESQVFFLNKDPLPRSALGVIAYQVKNANDGSPSQCGMVFSLDGSRTKFLPLVNPKDAEGSEGCSGVRAVGLIDQATHPSFVAIFKTYNVNGYGDNESFVLRWQEREQMYAVDPAASNRIWEKGTNTIAAARKTLR